MAKRQWRDISFLGALSSKGVVGGLFFPLLLSFLHPIVCPRYDCCYFRSFCVILGIEREGDLTVVSQGRKEGQGG